MRRFVSTFIMSMVIPGLVVWGTASPALSGTGCTAGDLRPQFVDAMVNQGLPYATLVRDKKSVVRFYLMSPECQSATQDLRVTGATLTGTSDTGASLGPDLLPVDALSSNPTLAPKPQAYITAADKSLNASNTSAANPRFSVPADYMDIAPDEPFTATFTMQLAYWYDTDTTVTQGSGTGTIDFSVNGNVYSPTRALRVLTVPMGFPATGFTEEEWVVEGFNTLSRVYPVPDGVSDLSSDRSAGIRYKILPTLLDLTALSPSGRFCGNQITAPPTMMRLLLFLWQHNLANDLWRHADRVLGAVDTPSSLGDESGCAEGMAIYPTSVYSPVLAKASFVRTVHSDTVSATGMLMAHEIGHNFGATNPLRSSLTDRTHSPSDEADEERNRAYFTSDASYMPNDSTVMRWMGMSLTRDATVLFEFFDWEQVFCRLGGPITRDCLSYYPDGDDVQDPTAETDGARSLFLAGVLNERRPSVQLVDAFQTQAAPSRSSKRSPLTLVQRDIMGREIARVPVSVGSPSHGDVLHGKPLRSRSPIKYFAGLVPVDPRTQSWAILWSGQGEDDSKVLLTRQRSISSSQPSVEASVNKRGVIRLLASVRNSQPSSLRGHFFVFCPVEDSTPHLLPLAVGLAPRKTRDGLASFVYEWSYREGLLCAGDGARILFRHSDGFKLSEFSLSIPLPGSPGLPRTAQVESSMI